MNTIELKPHNEPTEPGDYISLPIVDGLPAKDTRPILLCLTLGPKGLGIVYPGMARPYPISEMKIPCLWSDKIECIAAV